MRKGYERNVCVRVCVCVYTHIYIYITDLFCYTQELTQLSKSTILQYKFIKK